jgi:hypothetical protein
MDSATQLPGSTRPSHVFDTYWRFAAERQDIFFRRLAGEPPPWTSDTVLREYKFTNAFRASDRVSQYLIKNVAYQGPQSPRELFFRILVFKIFNRIDTWELLTMSLGQISFADYQFDRYDAVLNAALAAGKRIYSAAYIMPPGGREVRKHHGHLQLIERMVRDNVPERLQDCDSMEKGFAMLRSYPMIGDFLAYQFITDLNYSTLTYFSEMDFVAPGPGAKDGIRKCFRDTGHLSEADIVRLIARTIFASSRFISRTISSVDLVSSPAAARLACSVRTPRTLLAIHKKRITSSKIAEQHTVTTVWRNLSFFSRGFPFRFTRSSEKVACPRIRGYSRHSARSSDAESSRSRSATQ